MYLPCEIALNSYKPIRIERGMLFATESRKLVWELKYVPHDDEQFIKENGLPVEIFIKDFRSEKLAESNEIGWIDDGDEYDELRDISLHDINYILQQHNGECLVDCNQSIFMEENMVVPVYVDEKVVISFCDRFEYSENPD